MISVVSAIKQGLHIARRLHNRIQKREAETGEYMSPLRHELAAWRRLLFHAGVAVEDIPEQPDSDPEMVARWNELHPMPKAKRMA